MEDFERAALRHVLARIYTDARQGTVRGRDELMEAVSAELNHPVTWGEVVTWMDTDWGREELRRFRAGAVNDLLVTFIPRVNKAVQTLEDIMASSGSDQARVRAASVLLDFGQRLLGLAGNQAADERRFMGGDHLTMVFNVLNRFSGEVQFVPRHQEIVEGEARLLGSGEQ